MKHRIYLAGPVTGLTFSVATQWRNYVKATLEPHGIACYSPLRNKNFFKENVTIGSTPVDHILATDKAIMGRDYHDCVSADLLFVNLLGTKTISKGTLIELGFAFAHRRPVVMAIEQTGNQHDHPMVREAVTYRVTALDEAINITKRVLLHDAF